MRNAEFGIPSDVMEEIEYHENRKNIPNFD
jgi:hypothetical protein